MKIEGDENNQAGRDINITNHNYNIERADEGMENSEAETIELPPKVFRVHSMLVDVPFVILGFAILLGGSFLKLHLFFYMLPAIALLALGWYVMPMKFASLLIMVSHDHVDYKGERIDYSDMYKIDSWVNSNKVNLMMNNGKVITIKFINYRGKEYLFDAYNIYSK